MQSGSTLGGMISGKTIGYAIGISIFEYLQIQQEQLTILAILMVVDFITGIAKQYRINPQGIESHKAWV
jgi:phage-related holin